MSIDIQKSHGSKINLPYYQNELNIYTKHNIIYSENIFHAIIINRELYNLVIYNESDFVDVISTLVLQKYHNINLDFNHINQPDLISSLLSHHYNMPYILESSKIKLPTLNLIYSPNLDIINLPYITYMLEQYNNQDKSVCQAWATFNKSSLKFIQSQILDENVEGEISGELKVCETIDEIDKIVFEICNNDEITGGDKEEVDSIESRYNFHTHPICSYKKINTQLGWPSYDDYVIFVMAFIFDKIPTHFHWICTMEGIYVITIPEESVMCLKELNNKNYHKLEEKFIKYLKEYIDVNKVNFNKDVGIMIGDFLIHDVYSYLHYIELAPKFEIDNTEIRLFDVQFFEWTGDLGLLTNDRMYFEFYYPKINGNCIIKQEHVRK